MVTPESPRQLVPIPNLSIRLLITGWAAAVAVWISSMALVAIFADGNPLALFAIFAGGAMGLFMIPFALVMNRLR